MNEELKGGRTGASNMLGTILFGTIVYGAMLEISFSDFDFIWSMLAFFMYFFERGLFRSIVNNKWVFEGISDLSVKIGNRIRSRIGKNQVQELSHDKREKRINLLMEITFLLLQLPLLFLVLVALHGLALFQFNVGMLFVSGFNFKNVHTLYENIKVIDLWIVFMFFGHEVFNFFKSYKLKFNNLKTS